MTEKVSLLEFPCLFPIKIMGKTQEGFANAILEIVLRYARDFDASTMEMKPSRNGNYISLTCTINAVSQEQLDHIYEEISRHPMVIMAL